MVLSSLPEADVGKGRVQSWVVGSGVPTGDDEAADTDIQRETITALLKHYALQEKTGSNDDARNESALGMPPIVVDAGALDLLPGKVPAQVVVTPHVGELARMLTRLDGNEASVDKVRSQPLACARRVHELTGATVLLKGAVTMVVGTDGEGNERVILSGRAPAWMSTAGSGDVLAGMLGALLAQQDDHACRGSGISSRSRGGRSLHTWSCGLDRIAIRTAWMASSADLWAFQKAAFRGIGHPIIASDIIGGIQPAFLQLL